LLRKVKGKDGVGLSDCEELVGDNHKGDDDSDHAGRINLLRTILFHQIYLTFIMLYT